MVHAIDARSGKLLWRYDARAPEAAGEKLRVAWGIRGLAFWKNRVYAGTTDGRLIALNAADGTLAWSTQTVDPGDGAVISGAPRAFNGKIVIGFGGADFSPLRGYVTAYDAETGRKIWRFYTVPGAPGTIDNASSDDVMTMAAKTWTGPVVALRRRRHGLECHDLRPGIQPVIYRHRQWFADELEHSQPAGRRQPLRGFRGGPRCRYRALHLALPDDAG